MNLLLKATEFEKLAAFPYQRVMNFALELMGDFDPKKWGPGISVDFNNLKMTADKLYTALKRNKFSDVPNILKSILDLTRNGGGKIFFEAQTLYNIVMASK